MGKITLLFLLLFTTLLVSAQEVISTQGDSYSNSSGIIDFTLGEVIIDTGTDGSNDLTQGFHQTNWNFVGVEDYTTGYEATIFPNPAGDVLNIRSTNYAGVSYALYDAQGKLVLYDELSSDLTTLQVGHLAPGNYSLTLRNQFQNLKTFKLIKTY